MRKKTLCAFGAGAAIMLMVCAIEGIFAETDAYAVMETLCDGAFAAAVLLLGLGLLAFTSNRGVFDGLTYSVKQLIALKWTKKGAEAAEEFYAYRTRRQENRASSGFLLIPGAAFLASSALLLVLLNG